MNGEGIEDNNNDDEALRTDDGKYETDGTEMLHETTFFFLYMREFVYGIHDDGDAEQIFYFPISSSRFFFLSDNVLMATNICIHLYSSGGSHNKSQIKIANV